MTNIRKLLGGVSFIAVLLLNQPITWAQRFGDQIQEYASNCGSELTISLLGKPANDYTLNLNKAFKCTLPGSKKTQSFSLSGHAELGADLGIFGSSEAAGPAAGDGTTVVANDTLVLNPPTEFTGTSVVIGLKETYTLVVEGVHTNSIGSAAVCFDWTGRRTPVCFPLVTNGNVTKTLSVPKIVVNKTDLGFQLHLQLSATAGVATLTRQMFASVAIGSPRFTLPQGWTSTWASGEP
jgi:hypothetical protein